jgi:hypothetical protein
MEQHTNAKEYYSNALEQNFSLRLPVSIKSQSRLKIYLWSSDFSDKIQTYEHFKQVQRPNLCWGMEQGARVLGHRNEAAVIKTHDQTEIRKALSHQAARVQ